MVNTLLYPEWETLNHDTRAFAGKAHEKSVRSFGACRDFDDMQAEITMLLRDAEHIPLCEEHHARMYHFLQDEVHPKGVYRVSSSATYRAGVPDWTVLFAVAGFDSLLGDDVYLSGIAHCETRPERVLVSLSPAGADTAYTIEFDLATQSIVADGFHFPSGKSTVQWRDADSVWLCPGWDARQTTSSGYPREVWLMRRGQCFEEAQPIFQASPEDVSVEAWRYLDGQGAPLDVLCVRHGFFAHHYGQIMADGSVTPLPLPAGAEVCGYLGGFLLLRLREDWQRSREHYIAGSLMAVKYARGALHEACVLFHPSGRQSLECVESSRRFVLIHYLDDVAARFMAWRLMHNRWQAAAAPVVDVLALALIDQPYGGDVFYFVAEDLRNAPVLYAWDANADELSVLRRRRDVFATDGMRIEQHFARAEDGTLIPYFWCGSRAAPDVPTIVYVYGGFGVSNLPHYQEITGKYWLAAGGALVLANVRGGGEYGPDWHHAAQRQHKTVAVDDLLAVVGALQQQGYTSPAHTALQGGSNGALIVTAAMCRAPECAGAVVAEMPLSDMLRYHLLGAGASWAEEYGDADDKQFRDSLCALSPLHNLREGVTYPPVLITTDLNDDRVHPAHALKLYTRLRELGAPTWLYVNAVGGHEGNADQNTQAAEFAIVLRFLQKTIVGDYQ